MEQKPENVTESKPIWQSKTLWGLAIVAAIRSFPKLGQYLGGTESQNVLIDNVITVAGIVMAAIGRMKANTAVRILPKDTPKS